MHKNNNRKETAMEYKTRIPDFYAFDGEGDGGSLGAEASAFMQEIGMDDPFAQRQPGADPEHIEYGIAPEGEAQASQVGSDETAYEDLNAEFEALTGKGGKFHDLLGQRVSDAIQNRFRNQADLQGQVNKIADDLSPLFLNYGLKAGDFEGLKNAIASDENFYKAGAEREGLDIEQYKENLRLKADAERGRQITEQYEQQQRQNEMFSRWEREADELKQHFPNFDLGMELETNEDFGRMISNGLSVEQAFVATHIGEIMSGTANQSAQQASQDVVRNIRARAARPSENGLRHAPAIQRRSDPSSLTNEDMDEILRRVTEEGASVSF